MSSFYNIDDLFAGIVEKLSPIWGPFYAVFYILRLLWRELFRRSE